MSSSLSMVSITQDCVGAEEGTMCIHSAYEAKHQQRVAAKKTYQKKAGITLGLSRESSEAKVTT